MTLIEHARDAFPEASRITIDREHDFSTGEMETVIRVTLPTSLHHDDVIAREDRLQAAVQSYPLQVAWAFHFTDAK